MDILRVWGGGCWVTGYAEPRQYPSASFESKIRAPHFQITRTERRRRLLESVEVDFGTIDVASQAQSRLGEDARSPARSTIIDVTECDLTHAGLQLRDWLESKSLSIYACTRASMHRGEGGREVGKQSCEQESDNVNNRVLMPP